MEGGGNLWVKLDDLAALLFYIGVSFLDLFSEPLGELDLQHRRTHIANPFLRRLLNLLLIGEVLADFLVAIVYELGDLLDSEAIVLRDTYVPDVLVLDD